MRTHYHNEMTALERSVAALGQEVHENVIDAVNSLGDGDTTLAVRVMRRDRDIDAREVRNEETCLKIIALHQPVADDLRYLIVLDKVNHELERISDLAVEVARSALPPHCSARDAAWGRRLAEVTAEVGRRLQRVMEALPGKDATAARDLWVRDAEIDDQCQALDATLESAILEEREDAHSLFGFLTAVGHIERMGDHVKNIAKDIIYLVLGEIVRHRGNEFKAPESGRKIRVLFVCVHNSARSQMAEAWLNHLHGARFEAFSAGIAAGTLNPFAVTAMEESGMDISGHRTTDVFDLLRQGKSFDYLVTVCDEARAEQCPPSLGELAEFHWDIQDPADAVGDDREKLTVTRSVRDAIRERIETWVDEITKPAPPDRRP